jgi:hypothetical protein
MEDSNTSATCVLVVELSLRFAMDDSLRSKLVSIACFRETDFPDRLDNYFHVEGGK